MTLPSGNVNSSVWNIGMLPPSIAMMTVGRRRRRRRLGVGECASEAGTQKGPRGTFGRGSIVPTGRELRFIWKSA